MVAFLSHSLYPSSHSSLGCIATEVVNYFTYTPSDPNSNVLVIELTALPSTTLFVNPGFATYAQGTYNCVADELGYCYIILTCNGDCQSLRTIYFHVFGGPGSHSVRVTEESVVSRLAQLDDGPQSVSLSSGSQIYSFKLPVPAFGTNFSNPSSVPPPPFSSHSPSPLFPRILFPHCQVISATFGARGLFVDGWITRGAFSSPSSAVASATSTDGFAKMVLPSCALSVDGEELFVNFHLKSGVSQPSFSVNFTKFTPSSDPVLPYTATSGSRYSARRGEITRLFFSVLPLETGDVAYVRFSDVVGGSIYHTVRKGSHLASSISSSLPCSASCAAPERELAASFYDDSFHCGDGLYSDLYVDVRVDLLVAAHTQVEFTITVEVQRWKEIPPVHQSVTLPPNSGVRGYHNIDFYQSIIDSSQVPPRSFLPPSPLLHSSSLSLFFIPYSSRPSSLISS